MNILFWIAIVCINSIPLVALVTLIKDVIQTRSIDSGEIVFTLFIILAWIMIIFAQVEVYNLKV